GVGWLPFVLQAADYQFQHLAVRRERPEFQMLPSEYFRRQVYACSWFEQVPPGYVLDHVGVDNLMFETDFPHPTSIYGAEVPATIEHSLSGLDPKVRQRVLWGNAADLYGVQAPAA
ncbi:MAG: amidohydrolase family protein, partial [Gammaproteobacteria bacterium]